MCSSKKYEARVQVNMPARSETQAYLMCKEDKSFFVNATEHKYIHLIGVRAQLQYAKLLERWDNIGINMSLGGIQWILLVLNTARNDKGLRFMVTLILF